MIYKSPSNIALIKYMGKTADGAPVNSSLSYTLKNLVSGVELEPVEQPADLWEPLRGEEWQTLSMNMKEQERFLSFFQKLKKLFNLKSCFKVRSGNNFPKSSGAASSASSFSALTKAVYQQAVKEGRTEPLGDEQLALISRGGSGSSCRSFFSPWCLWDKNSVRSLSFPCDTLIHHLILTSDREKKVSSSSAHQRVQSSPYFEGRSERAENRLHLLMKNMKEKNWKVMKQIAQEEFEDMHNLFESSRPSFSYLTEKSRKILKILDRFWEEKQDGPLITMDAGPHIHLLYRPDQMHLKKEMDLLLRHVLCTDEF